MQEFRVEQFMPCDHPAITGTIKRALLPSYEAPLFIKRDLFACPMSQGFLINSEGGQFLVESVDLLRAIHGRSAREVCASEGDFHELEQYYHYGFVGYEGNREGKVRVANIDDRFVSLYDRNTTWFCYVPQKIELDVTHTCNLTCKHCSRDSSPSRQSGELSLQDYVDLIEQAGQLGVSALTFMGGEPTCNPELVELAIIAKFSGIRSLSTSTNGWSVTRETAEKMARVFDSIQVSLHGASPQTHDVIVGRSGAFTRARSAISLFRECNVGSLNISFTVMKENVHEMAQMVGLARELGVSYIRFLVLSPLGRGRDLEQWSAAEREQIGRKIKELYESNLDYIQVEAGGFPAHYPIPNNAPVYGCPAGRTLMYVNPDGIVGPCEVAHLEVGRIGEASLTELWHSNIMASLRKRPSCECSYGEICAGGCLANRHWASMFVDHEGGDADAIR